MIRATHTLAGVLILQLMAPLLGGAAMGATHFLIVAGLGGEPRYENRFQQEAAIVADAARGAAGSEQQVSLLTGEFATLDAIEKVIAGWQQLAPDDRVVMVMIGHGSHDGDAYRFNIPGRDLSAARLAELLDTLPARQQLLVNTTSASGGMLDVLAAEDRVLITATKSGGERLATRFGSFWAAALTDPSSDQDKNGLVSAREAFDFTQRGVEEAYAADVLLATEHPRLVGSGAALFTVSRQSEPVTIQLATDPRYQQLSDLRDELSARIEQHKSLRESMDSNRYLDLLQSLLLDLATVQQEMDEMAGGSQ